MIAKITRGKNPGNIGAYLHGPGTANEHRYVDARNIRRHGGIVIGGNLHLDGDTMPDHWVKEFRAAMRTRPEIKNPIWHVSLRNTERDRILSDAQWADAGQTFAEHMGFEEHPWVMVRHGEDHVHLVVSRVSDLGEVWHGRHDRRNAQRACTALEDEYGLEAAPRQRQHTVKQSVQAERDRYRTQASQLAEKRAQDLADFQRVQRFMRQMNLGHPLSKPRQAPSTERSRHHPVAEPSRSYLHRSQDRDQDRGFER